MRRRLVRLGFLVAALGSLSWSAAAILDENPDLANYVYDQAQTQLELQAAAVRLMSPAYVDAKFNQALDDDDVLLATSYRAVASDLRYELGETSEVRYQHAIALGPTLWRNTRKSTEGFIFGGGESLPHLAGAVVADFTLYGDARDVSIQARNYAVGEEIDELILGLSGVGLVLTAGTYASRGLTAPAKFWVSTLKFAKNAGSLTDSFATSIKRMAVAAVPFEKLTLHLGEVPYWQRIQGFEPTMLKDDIATALGKSVNRVELAKLHSIFGDLETISKASGSPETVVRTLKLIDAPEDLVRLRQISEIAGRKTAAYADSFGKRLLGKVKYSLKTTTKIYVKYASALASLIASLSGMFFLATAQHAASSQIERAILRS